MQFKNSVSSEQETKQLMQERIEKLTGELKIKESETSLQTLNIRQSISASYELKFSSMNEQLLKLQEEKSSFNAMMSYKESNMLQFKSQYEAMSLKYTELQRIIEREENERNHIIEARTHELQE